MHQLLCTKNVHIQVLYLPHLFIRLKARQQIIYLKRIRKKKWNIYFCIFIACKSWQFSNNIIWCRRCFPIRQTFAQGVRLGMQFCHIPSILVRIFLLLCTQCCQLYIIIFWLNLKEILTTIHFQILNFQDVKWGFDHQIIISKVGNTVWSPSYSWSIFSWYQRQMVGDDEHQRGCY